MRWLVRALIVPLLVMCLAAPAQAGPLRDVLQSVPTSGEVPTPEDLPTDDVDPMALAAQLQAELEALVDEATNGPGQAVEAVTDYVAAWTTRVKENGDCVQPDVVVNGGTPLVPPEIESGETAGHQWVAVHTGAVSVILYTQEDCLGTPQSQSYPGP